MSEGQTIGQFNGEEFFQSSLRFDLYDACLDRHEELIGHCDLTGQGCVALADISDHD